MYAAGSAAYFAPVYKNLGATHRHFDRQGAKIMKQPNIVLIMTDQLRGDCMGFAGHPDVKTPYLDTLASKGVVFDRAYSACPSCIAARAALHTGMEQSHHGRVGYEDNIPVSENFRQ